jgi:dTDP-glucose pyrophosphorylase/CBS domain-containing protein
MKNYLLNLNHKIKEALLRLEKNNGKCLIVVDKDNLLKGTITDGDVRRALLIGADINSSIKKYIRTKPYFIKNFKSQFNTDTLERGTKLEILKKTKNTHIDIIPVVDKNKKVVDLIFSKELNKFSLNKKLKNISTLIMAGGKGLRLQPFTNYFPKPLTPVNDKTAIEIIIDAFSKYDIKKFFISLNYKKNLIKSYLRENKIPNLHFIEEKKELGTAGPISLLKGKVKSDFFVINCDTIVSLNLEKFYDFHKKNNFKISLVAASKKFTLSYGSCKIKKNGELKIIEEKPSINYLANIGLYLLKPEIVRLIPKNSSFEMDTLIKKVNKAGGRVGVFPINEENWKDIGQK